MPLLRGGRAFATKVTRFRGSSRTTRFPAFPFQTNPFCSAQKVPGREAAWQEHLKRLNEALLTKSMCSKVSWNAVKSVYQPLLIEDSSQFPLAEVGRVHVRRTLDALDALDAGLGDIFSSKSTEARVSKSVKVLLCTAMLSRHEADLTLKAEAHLKSKKVAVRGRADYLVARGHSTLMVVEVKRDGNLLRQGTAQALLMLDIAFTNNPASSGHIFGIATDFSTWLLFKRTAGGIYWSSDAIAKETRDRDAERVLRRLCKMLQS